MGVTMTHAGIHYTLQMENPHTHIFSVRLEVTGIQDKFQDFKMPVWTPGSYLVREFSKNVITVTAKSHKEALPIEKISKNTWRVEMNESSVAIIEYEVYAFEMSVRTSFLDGDHAMINGASVFIYPEGLTEQEIRISIEPFHKWNNISTGLEKVKGENFTYRAKNLDDLIDCPIEIGNHEIIPFKISGIPHEYAIYGIGNYDIRKIVDDTKKVLNTTFDIFGDIPYQKYTFFLYNMDKGYGGLEHQNSCSMIRSRWKYKPRKDYLGFIGLMAHEFFHTYNVKRIRPAELGPFDYDSEVYTNLLWIAEGITSYYDNHIPLRANVITLKEYLNIIARDIKSLESIPGRNVQTIAEASFDSWVKFYRQNENSVNTTISYYLKGSLTGLALDLKIREITDGRKSLDDVFLKLWESYKLSKTGFTEEEFINICESVAGSNLNDIWQYVHTTREMNFNTILAPFGLKVKKSYSNKDDSTATWFGIKINKNTLSISKIPNEGPAVHSGLNVNDELIAVNDIRITRNDYKTRLKSFPISEPAKVTVSRNGILRDFTVTPIELPKDKFELIQIESPSDMQKNLYKNWLRIDWETKPED